MIYCLDETITAVYVGHTTNLRQRKSKHRSVCNNPKANNYNYYVYQFIRAHGGWDNWDIIVLETASLNNVDDAIRLEHKWFIEKQATLNRQVPSQTTKDYYAKNIDKILEQKKEYYSNNADKIKETKTEYYAKNIDKIKEKDKEYYAKNIDKILEQKKEYYAKNIDKIKEKDKEYYAKNIDKIKEKEKEYRANNADKIKETKKEYRANNADKIKEQKRCKYQKDKLIKFYTEYHSSCGVCK
jgi:hypothetical protein